MKRGRYNRPFLHLSTGALLGIGILIAPALADTYPVFSAKSQVAHVPSIPNSEKSISVDSNALQTQVSDKPRDSVLNYVVQKGDTISTIADKFSVTSNTIKWANNLTDDDLSIGQSLKILPVSGIEYKVLSGDTIYSIAKKFNTQAQKIVDFPFNNFANPETFSLVVGQMLIVPDGIKPSDQPYVKPTPSYIAQAPAHANFTGGGFHWPVTGEITQTYTWYHPGIDIAGPAGSPIYAAKSGTVVEASCGWNYGYGCHILINHGDGYSTMYAHMIQSPSVSVGQSVEGGQLIGYRGSTGRSTGNHTHFEIRTGNGTVNPLSYLQ